jgi:hypothetical protein
MKETSKLKLPLLRQGQINKELTLNRCFLFLDNTFSIVVKNLEEQMFPPTDLEEETMILTSHNSKESFEKHPFHLAFYKNGWNFIKPIEGLIIWNKATHSFFYFDGKVFKNLLNTGCETQESTNENILVERISMLQDRIKQCEKLIEEMKINAVFNNMKAIGINTPADEINNKLAVCSNNSLFTSEDGDIKISLNKLSAENTSSFIFQTAWQGRAEFGMIGEDKFILKVSPNGKIWKEIFVIDVSDGKINFKNDVLKNGKIIF